MRGSDLENSKCTLFKPRDNPSTNNFSLRNSVLCYVHTIYEIYALYIVQWNVKY